MMRFRFNLRPVWLLTALLLLPFAAFSQETNSLDTLRVKYETAKQRIDADALLAYGSALGAEMTRLKQKGDLDPYLFLETEKTRFEAAKALPEGKDWELVARKAAGLDSTVKKVTADRTNKMASLLRQYVAQLEGQIRQLMLADRMEDAKVAKEMLEEAKFNMADVAAKLSTVASGEPDPAIEVEKTGTPSSPAGEEAGQAGSVAAGRLAKILVIEKATFGSVRDGIDVTRELQDMVQDGKLIITPRIYDSFSETTGIKTKTFTIKYHYNKELARTLTKRHGEAFSLP